MVPLTTTVVIYLLEKEVEKKGTTMLLKIQVTGIYFHNIGVTLSGPGIKIKVKVDEQLLRKHSSPRGFRYRHV